MVSPLTKLVSALLAALVAAPVAAQGLADTQPVQVFKASADVVTIQASVRDARGRPVPAGLYFAVLTVDGQEDRARIVRLP